MKTRASSEKIKSKPRFRICCRRKCRVRCAPLNDELCPTSCEGAKLPTGNSTPGTGLPAETAQISSQENQIKRSQLKPNPVHPRTRWEDWRPHPDGQPAPCGHPPSQNAQRDRTTCQFHPVFRSSSLEKNSETETHLPSLPAVAGLPERVSELSEPSVAQFARSNFYAAPKKSYVRTMTITSIFMSSDCLFRDLRASRWPRPNWNSVAALKPAPAGSEIYLRASLKRMYTWFIEIRLSLNVRDFELVPPNTLRSPL